MTSECLTQERRSEDAARLDRVAHLARKAREARAMFHGYRGNEPEPQDMESDEWIRWKVGYERCCTFAVKANSNFDQASRDYFEWRDGGK